MRKAVRAIILKDDALLVMHRNKFGHKYDTLPGGNVEVGETELQALSRELAEEVSLEFANPRLVYVEHAGDPYGDQYIFLCDYIAGEPHLHPQAEESLINKMGQNLYEPGWTKISDLSHTPFLSEQLKTEILRSLDTGWPTTPLEFTTL